MSKVLQRTELSLRSFYIFNSKLGMKDGEEHKKILYYHPEDIELNTKIKDVGLSEAIIAFTGTFKTSKSDVCKALHTQKTTQLFFQPEPDYWMILVVNVPKEVRTKDGIEVPEYRGGEVHDRIYSSVLLQCYDMFRLFHGTFQMNLQVFEANRDSNDTDEKHNEACRFNLKTILEKFYNKYLIGLRLPASDLTAVMRSLQYLPLDKLLFLRAHNFVNTIRATFPVIMETMLLYKEQVVCSGKLHPIDIYCLNEYLVGTLLVLPAGTTATTTTHSDAAASSNSLNLTRSNSTNSEAFRNGAFLTACNPSSSLPLSSSSSVLPAKSEVNKKPPNRIFLGRSQRNLKCFYLIAYRALDLTICMLVEDKPHDDFYSELHSYIGPQLGSISNEISETLVKTNGLQNSSGRTGGSGSTGIVNSSGTASSAPSFDGLDAVAPKYLFINEQSLRHLSNIIIDQKRCKPAPSNIPANIINLIADLSYTTTTTAKTASHNLEQSVHESDSVYDEEAEAEATEDMTTSGIFKETLVKTTNDFWIVRRSCNYRHYFVIILNSKSTLLDVTLEAKRIFEQELTDDVFFDK